MSLSFYMLSFVALFFLWDYSAVEASTLTNSVQLTDGYTLNWGLSDDKSSIIINLQVNQRCWVGLGWHCLGCSEDGMTHADFAVAEFDANGVVTVSDRFSSPEQQGYTAPLLDTDPALQGSNNIFVFSSFQVDGLTSVTFERKLVTNDSKADFKFENGDMKVLWAHGDPKSPNPNALDYHQNNRGKLIINFFTGKSAASTNVLVAWHGSLMVLSFGVLMTFGIFIARYLKEYHWWFPLHIIVQVAAVLCAIVGFVLALLMTKTAHFANLHSWFGICTLYLAILAPPLGWAADLVFDPNRTRVPIWPDLVHRWVGRLTVLISYVTIILGMNLYGLPTAPQVVFGCAAGFCIFLGLYVEFYRKFKSREPDTHY